MEALDEEIEKCDRISDLPDSIIHHILSFLLIKDVIRTSFLSTRWRYLWTSVPILNFDGLVFSPKTKFMKFVDSVLLRRSILGIQTFYLRFGCYYCDTSRLNTWILAASSHNVRQLSLSSHTREPFELPDSLFTCSSITVLKLNLQSTTLSLPSSSSSSIHLPFLKTLQLTSLKFTEDNLTQLFSHCPVLHDLHLEDCSINFTLPVLHISSTSLRRLTIDGLPKDWFLSDQSIKNEIRISTPKLLSLEYKDYTVKKNITLQNMSSLVDVAMDFNFDFLVKEDLPNRYVNNFLRCISHTRVLALSSASIQLLSRFSDSLGGLPTFSNLNHLKVSAAVNKDNIRVITCLLHSSPKLECLSLDFFVYRRQHYCINEEEEHSEPRNVTLECNVDHLKVVKIKGLGGDEYELILVKYLLKNAKDLERMVIVFSKQITANPKLQMQISKGILLYPRGSMSSEVICESCS